MNTGGVRGLGRTLKEFQMKVKLKVIVFSEVARKLGMIDQTEPTFKLW